MTYTRRLIHKLDFTIRLNRAIEALGEKPNPRTLFEARSQIHDVFMEHTAPIAQGLLGKLAGDDVQVDTPAGMKRIHILSIE